jgi:hypothetical protein
MRIINSSHFIWANISGLAEQRKRCLRARARIQAEVRFAAAERLSCFMLGLILV